MARNAHEHKTRAGRKYNEIELRAARGGGVVACAHLSVVNLFRVARCAAKSQQAWRNTYTR